MYYLLDENYLLRGFQKLPYCLVKRPENSLCFLNVEAFEALCLCDGQINVSLPVITEETREILVELEKMGIVHSCDKQLTRKEGQEYRKHENRYIHTAHWSITGKCNYRCKHCYMSAPEAKLGELPHETVMDIAKQIADCGIAEVSLTGGEPLVRADFLEIVDALISRGVRISQIYSNGKLVTEKLLQELKKRGIAPEFNMSYDGDEGWHDWLRGMPDAGKTVLRAFDLCYEMGFPTGAETCLHQGNLHLLRQSLNTLAAHHCGHVKTNPVSDTALWKQYGADYSISLEELYGAYLEYIPEFFEDGMPISVMLGGFFQCSKGSIDWVIPSVKGSGAPCRDSVICGHARQTLYLSPEGRMLPCMPLSAQPIQENYPKVTDGGLAKGLSDSSYMQLVSTTLADYLEQNTECASCEYRWKCAGGCRASALQFSQDNIMAPDRAVCLLFRGGYCDKIKEAAQKAIEKTTQQNGETA
ncbi:MAG: radical SAM protein [Christensenella sp.]|nr:radical SAM protein [Christensenella sp.]